MTPNKECVTTSNPRALHGRAEVYVKFHIYQTNDNPLFTLETFQCISVLRS